MSVSDRLAQEDQILRGIRMTLSTFRCVSPESETRRRGAVYASSPITSGLRLYDFARENPGVSLEELRKLPSFKKQVMEPNLQDGERFGNVLRKMGYRLVIIPGVFFANGWAQEHYMSLWRQVIERFASKAGFNANWHWSTGCVEEFLIAVVGEKVILDERGQRVTDLERAADQVRNTIDEIDRYGYDPKPLYDLWRHIDLSLDAARLRHRVSA